jgi:hypothetical protein
MIIHTSRPLPMPIQNSINVPWLPTDLYRIQNSQVLSCCLFYKSASSTEGNERRSQSTGEQNNITSEHIWITKFIRKFQICDFGKLTWVLLHVPHDQNCVRMIKTVICTLSFSSPRCALRLCIHRKPYILSLTVAYNLHTTSWALATNIMWSSIQ